MVSLLLLLIVAIFLLIITIIDIKYNSVPAIFTTGALFVVATLFPQNLFFGVLAFILSWLLIEAEFFSGVADLKVAVIIGFLISNLSAFILFTFLIVILGVAYKIIIIRRFRKKSSDEIAFLPGLLASYIALIIFHFAKVIVIFS